MAESASDLASSNIFFICKKRIKKKFVRNERDGREFSDFTQFKGTRYDFPEQSSSKWCHGTLCNLDFNHISKTRSFVTTSFVLRKGRKAAKFVCVPAHQTTHFVYQKPLYESFIWNSSLNSPSSNESKQMWMPILERTENSASTSQLLRQKSNLCRCVFTPQIMKLKIEISSTEWREQEDAEMNCRGSSERGSSGKCGNLSPKGLNSQLVGRCVCAKIVTWP